ncbi:MAG: hypothetical protein ACRD2M_08510 [Terriglobales bacterium]
MSEHPEAFARLLTQAVRAIAAREDKTIAIVQDELGYALGKDGGSAIEFWRKSHIPSSPDDLLKLAQEIIRRRGLDREAFEHFLRCAGHPAPKNVTDSLFPPQDTGPPKPKPSFQEFSPFVVGPPITTPRQFFGRERELKRIFGLWRRFPLQHVAVIGQRRSGKTSLLHYLKDITQANPAELRPGQRADWLPQPERYRWLLVDFQDARMAHRERLLRHLLTGLGLPIPDPCDMDNFMDAVGHHLDAPTVILMDEIEAGLASAELDESFWWSLRTLVSHYSDGNLAFLVTAHASPAQLAHDHAKPSPFFNIFHILELGPFTEKEARDLIASSPDPFAPADVEWILDQSGRWPSLLQILCQACLTALEEGQAGDAWQEEGLRQMAPFRYLLDKVGP